LQAHPVDFQEIPLRRASSASARCTSVLVLIAACAIGLLAGACTGGGSSSTPPSGSSQTPISVSFSVPSSPAVSVQADLGTQNFTAAVSGDAQNKGVNFTLAGSGCNGSSCGTLANTTPTTVTYIAPAAPPASTVVLTAASVADPSKTAAVTITVTPAVAVAIAPSGAQTVQAHTGTRNFSATVSNDPQNAGVMWMLTGAGCNAATCGILSGASSASGASITYTAPPVAPNPAEVTLTATSVTDKNQVSSVTITVSPAISVGILPANPTVAINMPLQLTATTNYDAQNAGVMWSLQGSGSLSNQTATQASYTAPSSVPASSVTVTATSISDPAQSSTVTITVTPPITVSLSPTPGYYYPVFANNSYPLQLNQSQSFTATVQNDPNNLGVNWTVSATDCSGTACGPLSGVTITSALYTAPAALPGTQNPDTITLTATSIADPAATASVTIPISQGIPNAGPNASPGWFELPQTLLLPQCPTIGAIFGTDGCQGVIAAWGGGVADTTRNRLLFTGGGHENYAGNEVYALNLAPSSTSPITLTRINNPVFPSPLPSCLEDWGPPPTPSPRETYGNLAYISDADKMWLFGGAPFATALEPCRSGGMWTLDFSGTAPLWTQLNQTLTISPTGSIDLGANNSPAWMNGNTPTDINYADYLLAKAGDSLSGLVYVYISNADILASYNPSTNTLASISTGQVVPKRGTGQTQIRVNGVLDPVRHVLLLVGEGTMGWFDLNTLNATPPTPPPFIDMSQTMGQGDCGDIAHIDPLNSTSLQDLNSPGLAYDPVVDRVIGWAGGHTVYVIDTTQTVSNSALACKALTTYPGGPPQTPMVPAQTALTGAQYNGTFGRFRYFPALDIFAVVNDWQQNAFTFRMPTPLPPGY
jgi:hypothetical protein